MAATVLHLPGMTPDQPVRAMAMLGLCVVLEDQRRVTIAYNRRPAGTIGQHLVLRGRRPAGTIGQHVVLRGLPAKLNTVDAVAALIMTDMRRWQDSVLLDEEFCPPGLHLTPGQAARWIAAVATDRDPRLARQLHGLLDTDLLSVTGSGLLRRTCLDFTAGQQKPLQIVRRMCTDITHADMVATLTGEGLRYATRGSLRWCGVNSSAAYRALPPAEDPRPYPVGIEWLAWLGLAAFPVRDVALRGRFHWLASERPQRPADMLAIAGTVAANGGVWAGDRWSAPVRPSDRNEPGRYWEFGPASVLRADPSGHDHGLPSGATIDVGDPFAGAGPITDRTPLGGKEIAWLLAVKPETVQQWQYRDVLPPPRWPSVGGRPAWEAGQIAIWALESRRRFELLAYPPHPRTEPLMRWLIDWVLDHHHHTYTYNLHSGWFTGVHVNPAWFIDDTDERQDDDQPDGDEGAGPEVHDRVEMSDKEFADYLRVSRS